MGVENVIRPSAWRSGVTLLAAPARCSGSMSTPSFSHWTLPGMKTSRLPPLLARPSAIRTPCSLSASWRISIVSESICPSVGLYMWCVGTLCSQSNIVTQMATRVSLKQSCTAASWRALRAVLLGAGQRVHVGIPRRKPWVSRRSWRRIGIERAVLHASFLYVASPAKTL